jgi:PIN domain nuclease of toxin-antitoxin system
MLNGEPGAEAAAAFLPDALLSAVNRAEVVTKLIEQGMPRDRATIIIETLDCEIAPFDSEMALEAGLLHAATRGRNISLGDRCCLALGMQTGLPVVTADRAWANLGLDLEIRLLR